MKGESMTDPSNAPAPPTPTPTPTPNGDPIQHHSGTPEYGAPTAAPAGQDHGRFAAPASAAQQQPYGQPIYGQQEYGQSYDQPYGQPAPNANPYAQPSPAYGQAPPTYNQYVAPTGAVPLNKPYYGCPFSEAFLRFWQKYTVFRGRASRSEFWWWVLAAFGINIVLDILNTATDEKLGFLATIWGLATLIPTLALSVRRLHDTNKPGWWVAIFYIAMVIGLIIMIIGGGAALYGGFRSLGSYDYGYGSMAAGGLGAAVIGALITLAGCVVYIVFMALPSKPEGARFDDGAAATPMPQGAYGAPYSTPVPPNFAAPNAPAPGFNQPALAYVQPAMPTPDYGQPAAPAPDYGQVPAPQYGQPEAPAPQYGQVPPMPQNAGDESATPSEHTAPAGDNAQKPWQGQ
ncbi:MAG: DUF805 domain-containing protein [Bifidobacterium longum]|nr:DUF805 domain-containing protein [Bifidobacterium longum]